MERAMRGVGCFGGRGRFCVVGVFLVDGVDERKGQNMSRVDRVVVTTTPLDLPYEMDKLGTTCAMQAKVEVKKESIRRT
jgi:hypothetical protein